MPTPAARLLPPRDQVKPTGEFPLFQILAKERRQLVERNEAHAIVEVHVASALNDQQFLGFGSPLVGIFTELPGILLAVEPRRALLLRTRPCTAF